MKLFKTRSWSILLQTVAGASRSLLFWLVSCFWILASLQAPAIIDTNNNGISDIWERQYNNGELFPNNFNFLADPDGDGWDNLHEAIAGTDPFNGNPPTGILRPQAERISAVYLNSQNGNPPTLVSPEAETITWTSITGKQYTLQFSADLMTNWLPVGDPLIGTGETMSRTMQLTQLDGSIPPKLFWRIAVSDLDSDGDGLSDYEEGILGTNPYAVDTDGDGIWDGEEVKAGMNPLVWGVSIMVGTSGDLPGATSTAQQFVVVGDEEEDVPHHEHKQFTVPASETGSLFLLAIHSEEFPNYTRNLAENPYDDTVEWSVTPSTGASQSGSTAVNDVHNDWITDLANGESLFGYSPVHYLVKKFISPNPSPVTIDVDVTITNISDGVLPTSTIAAVVPISFKTYSDSIGGTRMAHKKNLPYLPSYTAYYSNDWKKCVSIIADVSHKFNMIDFLVDQDDTATRKILEKEVKWSVDGTDQTSHDLDYGGIPLADKNIHRFVHAKIAATNDNSDGIIFTMIPQSTADNFLSWYTSNFATTILWLPALPNVYNKLGAGNSDPEPSSIDYWEPPHLIDSFYHPGSAFEMRSHAVASTGSGHQACYDASGNLITTGVGAGSADFASPTNLTNVPAHIGTDVIPFIWALQLDGNPCQGNSTFSNLDNPMLYQGAVLSAYMIVRPAVANYKPQLAPGATP